MVLNYRQSRAEAESLADEIRASGRRAAAIQADVTQSQDVEKLFAAIEREFGRLDILVNNAGDFFSAKFEELTEQQWDAIMNVNLKSQFLCAQAGGAAHQTRRQRKHREHFLPRWFASVARLYTLLCFKGWSNHADALLGARA